MRLKKWFLWPVFTLLICESGLTKEKLSDRIYLDVEFRPRLEFDNRDFSSWTGYDAYATFRTRIGVSLENFIDNTTLYIMLADSRLMGFSDPYITGQNIGPNRLDDNLGVSQAFIEVRDLFGRGTLFKIGRMSNDQGHYRIFGPGNWNIYGPRTYDGLKIGYDNKQLSLHFWNFFGLAGDRHWYFDPETPGAVPDKSIPYKADHTLTGLDGSFLSNHVNILAFLDLDQKPVMDTLHIITHVAFSRFTLATYLQWQIQNGLSLQFDGAYQFGKQAYGEGQADISAYLFSGDISYQFSATAKPSLGLGFDMISGDDGKSQDKITNFYENYYSKHRYQGYMDFFSSATGIKSYGLQDAIVRLGVLPLKKLDCQFDLHHFQTQKSFNSKADKSKANQLGEELDMTLNYSIQKGLKIQIGYDIFWPTDDWQGPGSDPSTFGYFVMTASF